MSFIQNCLAPFMRGMVSAFVNEYGSRPVSSPASRGYDFRQHMQALAQGSGAHLSSVHERRASFGFALHGEPFIATTVPFGDRIHVVVHSRVEFPLGRIPADLAEAARDLSAQLPRYDLQVLHADDHSAFYVEGVVSCGDLTPQVFADGLREMADGMVKFDAWLARHGYGRFRRP